MTAKELAERRERIATAVLAGAYANPVTDCPVEILAAWAIDAADELIAQLDIVDEDE